MTKIEELEYKILNLLARLVDAERRIVALRSEVGALQRKIK